jgi:hypothetical protein
MKKLFLTSILTMCLLGLSFSQTLHIIDISAFTAVYVDNTVIQGDSVDLIVSFKLKESNLASQANFLFGTTPDNGSIITATASIISENGLYYIEYKDQRNEIRNYHVQCTIRMSNLQFENYQKMTVYVDGQNGDYSNRLYWTK